MPIKVLHYLDTAAFAGTEAHVLTLLQSLDPAQCAPALLCRPGTVLSDRAQAAGLPVFPAGGVRALTRLLRRERFALLHAHDGNSKIRAVLAAHLASVGTRVVATQHFVQPAYTQRVGWKGQMAASLHRLVNGLVAGHVAVSRAVQDAALARREVPAARMTVVPNGICLPQLPPPAQAQAIRAELAIPASVPLIATVARLSPEKGVTFLLRALPLLHTNGHLLIVGDGDLRQELEADVASMGLSERVHFLGFRTDVLDLVSAADVFVLPSLAEPFGIALVEAMALAKPTVAVAAGGPLEIVAKSVTGLLVPPADPAALAQAIQRLLDQPEDARAMGQAGRERVAKRFSAETMARQTEQVYQRCLL